LCLNGFVEITGHAGFSFFGECALHFAAAARTGNRPTDSAGIFSKIDPVKRRLDRCRANTEFFGPLTVRFSPALHEVPAIQSMLWHVEPPFLFVNPRKVQPLLLGIGCGWKFRIPVTFFH
jgi:hypothetical protein